MPPPLRLTPALRRSLSKEAADVAAAGKKAKLGRNLSRELNAVLKVLQDAQASRSDIITAGAKLQGLMAGVRAIAMDNGDGPQGTGFVDCINKCETEYSKCTRSNAEYLCDLQAAKCTINCALESRTGAGIAVPAPPDQVVMGPRP